MHTLAPGFPTGIGEAWVPQPGGFQERLNLLSLRPHPSSWLGSGVFLPPSFLLSFTNPPLRSAQISSRVEIVHPDDEGFQILVQVDLSQCEVPQNQLRDKLCPDLYVTLECNPCFAPVVRLNSASVYPANRVQRLRTSFYRCPCSQTPSITLRGMGPLVGAQSLGP